MRFESVLLLMALTVVITELVVRSRKRRRREPVADGAEDEPYRVFTTQFDWTGKAEELSSLLTSDHPDFARGWTDKSGEGWSAAQALAKERMPDAANCDRLIADAQERLRLLAEESVAVTLLVDQSGSMKGDAMAATCVALGIALDALAVPGFTTELLGYSTVGWQGGMARQHWIAEGKPARPGRLCALQHVIYKSGDEDRWTEESKRWMMHPDLLRENIDGEALRWAVARLEQIPATRKALLVISDGAPVDDATLTVNGGRYLERDLFRTIDAIERAGDIRLGAIGVGHAVNRYYRVSTWCDLDGLTATLLDQVATTILADARAKS